MKLAEIGTGSGKSLYAIESKGNCPVKEYLDLLDNISLKQFLALFDWIINQGPPSNIRKYRHVGSQIYELKIRSGGRILCFSSDDVLPESLILTHGFPKPQKKVLQREIAKALKYKSDLEIQIKKNKKIIII